MLTLKFLGRLRESGLFFLRFGLGIMFIVHGSTKIFGGPAMWSQVGSAISLWGITVWPTFWGFMAAFAEFAGGILFILGFFFRPAALMMTITMLVATTMHVHKDGLLNMQSFATYSHAMELAIVFFSLLFVGPGKFSIDGE